MISGWVSKLSEGFSGHLAGKPAYSRCVKSGTGGTSLISRPDQLCSCLRTIATTVLGLAFIVLIFTLSAAPAWATLAANTKIINQARFSYVCDGASLVSFATVTVTVSLVPATVSIIKGPDQSTTYAGSGTLLTDTYTITSTSNGPDTYNLAAGTGTQINNGSTGTATSSASIMIGATATVAGSTTSYIVVPSDGVSDGIVNGIAPGDKVVISGVERMVSSVIDNAGGTSTIVLSVALPSAPNVGVLVSGEKTVSVNVSAGTIVTHGQSVVVPAHLTVTSSTNSSKTAASGDVLNTYIDVANITKYVRNVTSSVTGTGTPYSYGGQNYYPAGVTARSGDILEYILVPASTGTGSVTAAVVTDILPTSYVTFKTSAYGSSNDITYVNEAGTASYLTANGTGTAIYSSPNLTVNVGTGATGSTGGVISAGKSVLVLYQVTVNGSFVQGSTIVNNASLSYGQGGKYTSFVTVASVAPVASSIEFLDAGGQPAIGYKSGDTIYIQVADGNQNINPTVVDTVKVVLTDPATGDTETVTLTETGPNTGIFRGSIATSLGASATNDGTLTVTANSSIQATYTDPLDVPQVSTALALIDPRGVVFDSTTGNTLAGAVVTLRNWNSVKNSCDLTSWPVLMTGQVNPSSPTGADGKFTFPLVPPGDYCFDVAPPQGYTYPSTVTNLPTGFNIGSGSRGDKFTLSLGDPALIRDIPVDPASTSLWLQKTANKESAGYGDFILYELTVTNGSKLVAATGIQAVDTLPVGFRLRKGSVKINGVSVSDPAVSSNGRTLTFNVGTVAAGSSVIIDYVVEVTAGTILGDATNNAVATTGNGKKSNNASVTVRVSDDFMRTKSILMGHITTGECNGETGEGARGVEDVRVYLEDGSFVISDKRGMFHFEGVNAGLHVVQLDVDSLPEGYEPFACTQNSRFAGRSFSQFVETKGGTLWRTDFHIRKKRTETALQPLKGEIVLQLANKPEQGGIVYGASMTGSTLPVRAARLNIKLPEGVIYQKGTSMMDGVAIADPLQKEKDLLVFNLRDLPAGWHREITFTAAASRDAKAGELVTSAYLAADGNGKTEVLTPPAETILQWDKKVEMSRQPDLVLRPRFPVRSAELSAEDRKELDELAKALSGLYVEKIMVTGYTDNIPIAQRHRGEYADNQALSLARAGSVGHYLMSKLHLPPERLVLEGKGSADPIADNRIAEGRAINRRVELRITSSRVVDKSILNIVKETSGEKRAETTRGTIYFAYPDADENGLGDNSSSVNDNPVAAKNELSSGPAPSKASSASGPEEPEITIKEAQGILAPVENDILVNNVNSVRVCLNSDLTPRLSVDNKEVPSDRIGFTMKDAKAGKTIYSYIGVDFGNTGKHIAVLEGVDPFGNVRFNQKISVKRSGEIRTIRLKSSQGNIADGKTPVKIHLEFFDADGNLIPAAAELEIRDGTLSPLKKPDIFAAPPDAGSRPRVQMSREGEVLFQPVNNSGPYRVVLGYNNISVEAETYVQPKMRDWILVGLAEGTAGYNTITGSMENLQNAGVDDKYYKDGRVAFFAKGQIKGKWLLTIAYDSAKTKETNGNGLFQTINPETYYTLYGDSSQQQYDAASSNKLYVKIEREQFYAMFGDYDTGLTITELSRYSRRMNGFKTEMQSKNYELNAFASETEQLYSRDEIPGDGTSGIYRLSHQNIVSNSETITIQVRDRFRSEVLISSTVLTRFTDYSIDYDAGTILFKAPVYSRDEKFNPIIIVAEYEILSTAGKDYTYGGRAGVKLFDNKLKAGGSYIHEGQGDRSGNLYGVDASMKIDDKTKIRGEYAYTDYSAGVDSRSGDGYLAEVSRTTKQYDAKAYFREQDTGFGLGQQPGSEAGTRKYGVEGAYRFNENMNLSGDVYRQYNLLNDATRDMAEGKFGYSEKNYGASVGFLHADDSLNDGSNHESDQLTLGGKIKTLYDRLTLTVDHAQSIGSNDNSDFPTRTSLGAEYAATKTLTLLAAQEFTWGSGANTSNTRLGMRSSPWAGATLNSTINRQFNENDDRVFADVGLKQSWKVNEAWKTDVGVERSQTVTKSEYYQFNTNVSSASGNVQSASGITEDFTAVSAGATYQVKSLTWDNRVELRLAETENKWSLMSGAVKEMNSDWAASVRLQVFQTSATSSPNTFKIDLRQGLAYRPPQTKWIALNRLDFIIDDQSGNTSSNTDSWRLVDNLMLNYRPRKEMELSLHYGAKYVQEKIYDSDYTGYTDLIGAEGRYDINKDWDIGLQGSILHSWNASNYDYSTGLSIGYSIMQNVWLSLGYNLTGFADKDFSQSNFTAQGPFVRFRLKFDQNSVGDAAKWLNSN